MDNSLEKQALIKEIEGLIESDPIAVVGTFEMMEFLEMDDLISIHKGLLKSKENRSKENDVWFDELCKKD
ncbi:MAG: hypothetical protein J0647_01370 [Campylobacteraceae bacterium]|nr:hypothetical protein [Campylobacteraceae bacterium]